MQNGDIIQIGSGCTETNSGQHQVEDWCRMCGQSVSLAEIVADVKRYKFILKTMVRISERSESEVQAEIDKEMEKQQCNT